MPPENNNHRSHRTIIVAVIAALFIIVSSFVYTRLPPEPEQMSEEPLTEEQRLDVVRSIEAGEYVWGNPNAPVLVVTYNDFSCPFCKEYHSTLHNILDRYGREGNVAWVFRHMPLVQLHPEAPMYALASECVGSLNGNNAFWTFSDALFEAIDIDKKPDASELLDLAERAGVSRPQFTACMRENAFMIEVEKDFDEARFAGSQSTPFTVLITPDTRVSYEGARSFFQIVAVLDSITNSLNATDLQSPSAGYDPTTFGTEEAEDIGTTTSEEAILE